MEARSHSEGIVSRLAWAAAVAVVTIACGSPQGDGTQSGSPADAAAPPPDGGQPVMTADTGAPSVVVGEVPCATDTDCVPAECCHAAECTGRANAPACTDVMCTMECRAGTMDCGGGCICQDGLCAARLGGDEPIARSP